MKLQLFVCVIIGLLGRGHQVQSTGIYRRTPLCGMMEGYVRLSNGSVRSEGRVEVYCQSQWQVVCDDFWDLTDANVVCRELGYPAASEVVLESGFGDGEGDILLDDLMCTGYESALIECGSDGFFNHDCSRNEIAGVVCATESTIPFDSLRLIDGPIFYSGRVELYYNNFWRTVCGIHCRKEDANVICRQLGFYAVKELYNTTYLGVESRPILLQLGCDGNEKQWKDCPLSDWNTTDCSHEQDAGVTCKYADEGDIRLTGGDGYKRGTVEIYHDFAWGTVCDDHWNIDNTNVVCRQLGFKGALRSRYDAFFGQGQGQIVLDDVRCTGFEQRLEQCHIRHWYNHNCDQYDVAGVECSSSTCVRPGIHDSSVIYSPNSMEYQHSETVTFSCEFGYFLEGETIAICQLGSWELEFNQTCQASPCGRPGLVDSSVIYSPSSAEYQSSKTVTFSCEVGYFLKGETTAVCQLGSWDLEFNQTCQPSPCGRPGLADSSVIYSPSSTEYQHSETVTFSCEVGYFLEGETTAVCRLGSWELEFNQTCQPSPCGRPGLVDSSVIYSPSSAEYQHSETVTFSCEVGYFLEGETTAVCQLGTWDLEFNQTCQPSPCGRLGLANSSVIYSPNSTKYQHGETVTFSCEVGYFLEGEMTAVCQLGTWDLEFNQTCQPSPCGRPGLADARHYSFFIGAGFIGVVIGVIFCLFFVVVICKRIGGQINRGRYNLSEAYKKRGQIDPNVALISGSKNPAGPTTQYPALHAIPSPKRIPPPPYNKNVTNVGYNTNNAFNTQQAPGHGAVENRVSGQLPPGQLPRTRLLFRG